ncbi:ribonuclease HII [Candidatus Woesearchaeota archaeon]|nr:ribonuclease HII [Candidatus Woesearchaeota archaeon]
MVVCGVMIEEDKIPRLKALGVKDSKLLTPKKREFLFEKIKNTAKDHKIIVISPKEVDGYLQTDHLNLNKLEAQKMAEIINSLDPDKTILDCPSNNIKAYEDYLKKHLKDKNKEVIAEHKADFRYIIVAAASILAKVTRDNEIKKIKEKIGIEFGSGYPSDPRTVKFLNENWDKYPSIFRKTWISYKNVLQSQKQKSLEEF